MGNISSAGTDPQDSTYDPARSVTAETETSHVFATSMPFHKDAKYIVFEKCLLSLFESCPVCTRACNVSPCRRGTFLAIDQLCPHCEEQNLQLHYLSENKNVILGGDMRADSPGHSAKYGSYTMMNLQTNNTVDIQLVQSNEVGRSYHMEKEGIKRSLDLLEESGIMLDCIVIKLDCIVDRHP